MGGSAGGECRGRRWRDMEKFRERVAHLVVHGDNLLVDEQVADRVAYGAVTLHDGNCEFRHVVNP